MDEILHIKNDGTYEIKFSLSARNQTSFKEVLRRTILFLVFLFVLTNVSIAQQLELNSTSFSTATTGALQTAGPATFLKNTGTSTTFSAYSPTTTFSVSISNQQYTSAALPGVTVGYTSTALFKPVKDGVGSGVAASSYFTSSPNPATSGTNFNTTDNYGFMIYVEPGYQKLTSQPLNARNYYADMTVTFNRPVVNPVLHFCGIGKVRSTVIAPPPSNFYLGDEYQGFYSEFELSPNDVNNGISLTRLSGDSHFSVVSGNKIVNNNTSTTTSTSNWTSLEAFLSGGSVRVNSGGVPITTVTFRIYLRGDGGTNNTGYGAQWPDMTVCVDDFTLSASLGMNNLSGTVYQDNDGMIGGVNGTVMSGVTVGLYDGSGVTLLATTTTNASGYYEFTSITAGSYVVKVIAPLTYNHLSSTDLTPTDGQTNVVLDGINNTTGVDFGLAQQYTACEFISNGSFTTNLNGWTAGTGWAQNNGRARNQTDNITNQALTQSVTALSSNAVELTFELSALNTGSNGASLSIQLNGVTYATFNNPNTTAVLTATAQNGATINWAGLTAGNSTFARTNVTITIPYSGPQNTNLSFVFDAAGSNADDFEIDNVSMKGICPVKISGTIFNDINSNTRIDGAESGSSIGNTLYVYLVNSSNLIVDSANVQSNGTYSLDASTNTNYTIKLSSVQYGIGTSPAIYTTPPVGWITTGENGSGNNTGSGDGTPNGALAVNVATTDVVQQNFGLFQQFSACEYVSNGTFTSNLNGWTSGTGWAQVGPGVAQNTADGITNSILGQTLTNVSNGNYVLSLTMAARNSSSEASIVVRLNGVTYATFLNPASSTIVSATGSNGATIEGFNLNSGSGSYNADDFIIIIPYSGPANPILEFVMNASGSNADDFYLDNISLKGMCPLQISGTVFNDVNSNTRIDGGEIGTSAGTNLFAYLINSSGVIIDSAKVASNGTYTLGDVTSNSTNTIKLSTVQYTIGTSPTINTTPPEGWERTGENAANNTGSGDGNPDGQLSVTVGTSNFTNANFGLISICNPLASGFTDFDGDGIGDYCDLDDDNDGILDCVENGLDVDVTGAFKLNHDATMIANPSSGPPNQIQLTPASQSKDGQAWSYGKVDFTKNFTLNMQVYMSSGSVDADGIAIVFQNSSSGTNATGINGQGLGARGISNGIALELDIFQNSCNNDQQNGENCDPNFDHGTIRTTSGWVGAGKLTGDVQLGNGDIADDIWHNVVTKWDASTRTISYTFDGVAVTQYTFPSSGVNSIESILGGTTAYFGYTASTGSNFSQHKIGYNDLCSLPIYKDTDGDGIPNHLDLDSDNDGCPDAIEGSANFNFTHLNPDGSLSGGVSSNGIPLQAGTGQGIGTSQNSSMKDAACGITITGSVFNDLNGGSDNDVNGIKPVLSQPLYANLLNASGVVLATVPVDTNGNYTIPNVINGSYTVQISINQGVVNQPAPAQELPSGWENTGDEIGSTQGTGKDGVSSTFTVSGSNVSNVNFGISPIPIADNKTYLGLDPETLRFLPTNNTTYPNAMPLNNPSGSFAGPVSLVDGTMPGNVTGTDYNAGFVGASAGANNNMTFVTNGIVKDPNNPSVTLTNTVLVYTFEGQPFILNPSPSPTDPSYIFWNPTKGQYEIPQFNPNNLQVWFDTDGQTGFTFEYAWINQAGVQSNNAAFNVNATGPLAVLPVTWVNFSATLENGDALLNWNTASEFINAGFEVQHSLDGINFEVIGWVNGNGTTSTPQQYGFVHENISQGIHYYRLKQIDFDAQFEYSKIISLAVEVPNVAVTVYPIPAKDILHIKNAETIASISIYDISGKLHQTLLFNGATLQTINLQTLTAGTYSLVISHQNGSLETKKIIIQ